jgi:hypothetical protein
VSQQRLEVVMNFEASIAIASTVQCTHMALLQLILT